jgi:hypothetical protein
VLGSTYLYAVDLAGFCATLYMLAIPDILCGSSPSMLRSPAGAAFAGSVLSLLCTWGHFSPDGCCRWRRSDGSPNYDDPIACAGMGMVITSFFYCLAMWAILVSVAPIPLGAMDPTSCNPVVGRIALPFLLLTAGKALAITAAEHANCSGPFRSACDLCPRDVCSLCDRCDPDLRRPLPNAQHLRPPRPRPTGRQPSRLIRRRPPQPRRPRRLRSRPPAIRTTLNVCNHLNSSVCSCRKVARPFSSATERKLVSWEAFDLLGPTHSKAQQSGRIDSPTLAKRNEPKK